MKRDYTLIELTINIFIFIVVVAGILQLVDTTASINSQNRIRANSTIQLTNITSLLDNQEVNLDDYYQVEDQRIYFDQNNANVASADSLYYIAIDQETNRYTLTVYDKYDNLVELFTYEVLL